MKKMIIAAMAALMLAGCASPKQEEEKIPEQTGTYPAFNLDTKTVRLNSGYDMPVLGLGMFSLSPGQAENSTYWALKAGFRLIDTARIYGNEEAAECAAKVQAKHNIPYHNSTKNDGYNFDPEKAEQFETENRIIILPGEELVIE